MQDHRVDDVIVFTICMEEVNISSVNQDYSEHIWVFGSLPRRNTLILNIMGKKGVALVSLVSLQKQSGMLSGWKFRVQGGKSLVERKKVRKFPFHSRHSHCPGSRETI